MDDYIRYADSAQARELGREKKESSHVERFGMTAEELEAKQAVDEANRVAAVARVKLAVGKLEVFFGYAK